MPTASADRAANRLAPADRAVHDWYRFVLSFPPHLVRAYLERWELDARHLVLDPFCGTGTVLVEGKKLGLPSVGLEANRLAHFAARVKVDWEIAPEGLLAHAERMAGAAEAAVAAETTLRCLPPEAAALLSTGAISPRPLHKALLLLDGIDHPANGPFAAHERLALARVAVEASNLRFGPEVSVGRIRDDAPVVELWLEAVRRMAADLAEVRDGASVPATVHLADARRPADVIAPGTIDAVFTSPPYPNEKDYTRATRLESVVLGFVQDRADLRAMKRGLLRSNSRNVYHGDDDHAAVADVPAVQRLAAEIEARRLELGKTSGFERLYGRVTRLYFGGLARHLAELRPLLRPGARLGYVVGDQASFFRVHIPTGELLAEIAERLGYVVEGRELFRTRLATATGAQLREEVVVLRWDLTP